MSPREPTRPSADALLKVARAEARGKLKIFLGAAPGVGKTFEMLREGADQLRQGRDVVAGIIETHGRAETEALAAPFELIERKPIAHGGHTLPEFDIDAMLERRPQIALIDELAHSNAPGSRHPKRWQDIEELRDAGIDVLTTLNIQHIESLNDVVAGFTRVRVRETVPDAVLDDAEIEVVDVPADELIARLRDGKVYVPEEASRALGHFFSKANLSALRELALRRAAQTVDRQMLAHVDLAGEVGNWAAGERVVVAVNEQPGAEALVRTAKRLADAFRAPWTAVTIETPRSEGMSGAERARLAGTLNLAAGLGAVLATVPAASVVDGLRAHVGETRATTLVLGKTRRSWWFQARHGSVVDQLVRELPGVAIHVVPSVGETPPSRRAKNAPLSLGQLATALAMVAATTLFNLALVPFVGVNAVDLIYLTPVIAAATLFGLRPALFASVTAALAYNFFFLAPTYTLTIQDPQNIVTFLVLVGVGVVASQLAGRVRREANIGARTAGENAAIAAFGQRLGSVSDQASTSRATCEEVASLLDVATIVLAPGLGGLETVASCPEAAMLSPLDLAAAEWAQARGETAGRGTATLTAADWQFHPLKTSLGVMAVLGISRASGADPLAPEQRVLFATLLGQSALAHERLQLEQEARRAAALEQRDDLRATLISSLGHDLKTPLTAVVAAAEALTGEHDGSPTATLLRDSAHRLRRLFDDLVEMTRLESGTIAVRGDAIDLTDAVAAAAAAHDLRGELAGRKLVLEVPPSLPLVQADPRMLHHILVNLLDNAAKYSPPGTPITIRGTRRRPGLTIDIVDSGRGLPEGEESTLFDRFRRVEGGDQQGGTGLGLAIVKGFAVAMGLSVSAANRGDAPGSRFTIAWPEALVRSALPAGAEV